ncbi:MAG: 3-dehydroquinate synthase [Terriglobia bacterium]
MNSFTVNCEGRTYPIHVGLGILPRTGKILKGLGLSARLIVISHPQIFKAYGHALNRSLDSAGFEVSVVSIPAGEKTKSLATVEKVYYRLLKLRPDRQSTLVAFGGGVVGDLTGFVAATYLRGIGCVQIPTTFLAQIDSAIGGKTGVNLIGGKNLVGAFHQPKAVIADPLLLLSLPPREFHSGLYEAIKYGIIRSRTLFDLIHCKHSLLPGRDKTSLERIVAECAGIKAEVVSADERESGLRMILNFGHTIGHAIEAATQYRQFTHGEAIAHGMIMATQLSEALGKIQLEESREVIEGIRQLWPLPPLRSLQPSSIFRYLLSDKKIIENRLRFVLPRRVGRVDIVSDVPRSAVQSVLHSYLHARS